jgi:anti-sigma regulatory factor (Ser/Thr protein kinase)
MSDLPSTDSHLVYEPRPEHVRDARDHVADLLQRHGWTQPAIEKARLVISEMVTNAVLHAQTPFELRCQIGGTARFEVRDWVPTSVPLVRDIEPSRPGGLGLRLIEAIATDWGVETHPEFKVVWCTIDADDWPADIRTDGQAVPD